MAWWEALILGLVQGLTEFLPVSSSGHLVLGQYFLGIDEPGITFEVFVHFGTVMSILTVYRRRVFQLLADLIRALATPSYIVEALRPGTIEHDYTGDASEKNLKVSVRLAAFILLSMIPTGLVYVFFGDWLASKFTDPRFVCAMLLVTGVILLMIRFRPDPNGVLSPVKAMAVGLAQGAAMIPGISRSGSTIMAAIYLNVDRKQAADFSFLMSIPVILGATLLDVIDIVGSGASPNWVPLFIGALVAYVSGVWAIRVVLDFVKRGKLQYFGYYLFVVGTLGLIFIR